MESFCLNERLLYDGAFMFLVKRKTRKVENLKLKVESCGGMLMHAII